MSDLFHPILLALAAGTREASLPPAALDRLRELNDDELGELCLRLSTLPRPTAEAPAAPRWTQLLTQIAERWRPTAMQAEAPAERRYLPGALVSHVIALYLHLQAFRPRHHLLRIFTAVRGNLELQAFAELIATDPPASPVDLAVALWPLFKARDYDPAWIFPRLLDGLVHPSATASVLDLANYLTRAGRVAEHPARQRSAGLIELLGAIVGRLGQLEGRPVAAGESREQLRDAVAEGVAMAVSLCDALALSGDRAAVGKLYQALALGHRRLRVEAAAALARLDEEEGRTALVALAAEPLVRLRVLHYAEELGLSDRIPAEHSTPVAQAEGELVAWLASPHQFGIPPQACELIDQRDLPWPGCQEPAHCFLFRYTYAFPQGEHRGIGLAGPEALTFGADMTSLPADDLYAAFAGQSAAHDEIREIDVGELSPAGETEVKRLERRLKDAGFSDLAPLLLGYFFGERTLLAEATRDGQRGAVVVDDAGEHWFPILGGPRAPGPREFYCLYKGRRLLQAFGE